MPVVTRRGRLRRCDVSIPASKMPQIDPRDVGKSGGAAPHTHAAVPSADPYDPDFEDLETGAARKPQQLDIEGKSLDCQVREQRRRRVAPEQLEAALCVVDASKCKEL